MSSLRSDGYVAVTDQATKKIILLDSNEDWNTSNAVKWIWQPGISNCAEELAASWGLPTDAKIRTNPAFGGQWVVVTDSLGLAAIVSYPQGEHYRWGLNVGGNPHSAELLPNGNIAVAASDGGWLRIYASSQGANCFDYAEYSLPGAHGVQWDPEKELLWALGDDDLVALAISGTDGSPIIREVHKVSLPTAGGHDLQPVYGDTDRLWVSTRTKVYQYVKSANAFDERYPGYLSVSRAGVKSVGNLPSGQVVATAPDGLYRPETGFKNNNWCTNTVQFINVLSDDITHCVLPGSALYKARIWNSSYQ